MNTLSAIKNNQKKTKQSEECNNKIHNFWNSQSSFDQRLFYGTVIAFNVLAHFQNGYQCEYLDHY